MHGNIWLHMVQIVMKNGHTVFILQKRSRLISHDILDIIACNYGQIYSSSSYDEERETVCFSAWMICSLWNVNTMSKSGQIAIRMKILFPSALGDSINQVLFSHVVLSTFCFHVLLRNTKRPLHIMIPKPCLIIWRKQVSHCTHAFTPPPTRWYIEGQVEEKFEFW